MCDHHHLRTPTPAGEVEHVAYLSENIGQLFMQEDYSDVVLVIENERFPTHKVVLAARSEYFRAMLYGGMKESTASEIELKDTNPIAFKHLLKYIYTGKMLLSDLKDMFRVMHLYKINSFIKSFIMKIKEEILLEVMGLAHQYVFRELEVAISDYLKANLNTSNVCLIYDIACTYDLKSLCVKCWEFMDMNAAEIINHESFKLLSANALKELISRDSFCVNEIDIFRAIQAWKAANPEGEISGIVRAIRLPLMSMEELLGDVRSSNLVCPDALLDAIKVKNDSRNMDLKYRGFLCPEENVATLRHSAQVIRGEMKASLLDGDNLNYDLDRGFTRHPIDDNNGQGVVIKLCNPYIINTVRMLLWDRDTRSYSYRIDVSMDDKDWVTVIDYSKYLCRSWQYLRFPPTVVRYIRIVGTHNTVNRVFHVVSFECLFSLKQCLFENGIIVPLSNVATIEKSACVIEGVSRSRNALINGDTKNYDWDSGYTCHQLGSGAIVVQLAQPYIIDSMRLLLWDCDVRSYSYYVEVSTDQQHWSVVADKTREACRSWQTITFQRQAVTFIRIVGTHNTANEVFHCVHFECPADVQAIEEYERTKNSEAMNLSTNGAPRPVQLCGGVKCGQSHRQVVSFFIGCFGATTTTSEGAPADVISLNQELEEQDAGSEPEDERPALLHPRRSPAVPTPRHPVPEALNDLPEANGGPSPPALPHLPQQQPQHLQAAPPQLPSMLPAVFAGPPQAPVGGAKGGVLSLSPAPSRGGVAGPSRAGSASPGLQFLGEAGAQHSPQPVLMRLQRHAPVDRGDGFGLEPGENNRDGSGSERGGSPVHSD